MSVWALGPATELLAAGPTFTDTSTATQTPTSTPTPSATSTVTPSLGEGSWTLAMDRTLLVTGSSGYSAVFTYNAGATAWPAGGGLLTLFFPLGLDTPGSANFFAAPAYGSKIQGTSFSGQTVSVQVKNLDPGASIAFYYGYNATGLSVSTTQTPLTFGVMSYPQSVVGGLGAVVTPGASQAPLVVVTATPTSTVTPTSTISATHTVTGTITPTFSITQTFTETPIGPEQVDKVYVYPNPYNMAKFDKCTIRFPNAADASVTVFNLVGEPVRQIPLSDINAPQGWAVWDGRDDYLRQVTGGMYFVRATTPQGTRIKKFTVLH